MSIRSSRLLDNAVIAWRIPCHELLPPCGELGGKEARKVSLYEAEDEHMPNRCQRCYQDDGEWYKYEKVPCSAPQRLNLSWLQGLTCTGSNLVNMNHLKTASTIYLQLGARLAEIGQTGYTLVNNMFTRQGKLCPYEPVGGTCQKRIN